MENVSGENPYISISSFRKNSIFMITIKNRYEGELNYKDSDLPETTKSGKEHGIGLHNIQRVARMYMGCLLYTSEIIRENFDLRPAGIIKMLDLRRPIYKQTAAYGHFGRNDLNLPWEALDKADELKKYL